MRVIVLLWALFAAPYWESKTPREWSDRELSDMLNNSPWARAATAEGILPVEGVQTYLASALPMREAEAERVRRGRMTKPPETAEFDQFLKDRAGESIVLTVSFPDPNRLADGAESKRMEEECVMKVGRKKYKMTGHFPPTPSDPYLRLVFPRGIKPADKTIEFELYLPGVTPPYRTAQYVIKELMYRGKLEL
jgi:hypothetical protein